ncbi:spindle assembly checkpoint protein Mad2p, partial [Globomyces pollinis-pini]
MKSITLEGSSGIVLEFFEFALNSILYQRGLYTPECFTTTKKYNLTLFICEDEQLNDYLKRILSQVKVWIESKSISRLVMAIIDVITLETIERWQFDIHLSAADNKENANKDKSESDIHKEIAAIIRQITASVGFLPILRDNVSFNILAYTDKDVVAPTEWVDSDAKLIRNAEQVKLRSFSTSFHKVDGLVAYQTNF